jgi:H+-translocating NAD(P) transhydrogenase subunit alpha
MKVAIPKERRANERRVAASPDTIKKYKQLGLDVVVETGAGKEASIPDQAFADAGATIAPDEATALSDADIVLKVQRPLTEAEGGPDELALMKPGAMLVAILQPYQQRDQLQAYADAKVNAFAMELMPRITRAQSMDVLSSQANLAGYRAVVDAASEFGRAFPMMMTAAGTIPPARVMVMGAGVAGLQAIASARRMGAKVEAYDVRPAVKEQVQSLGARFVELPLESADAEDKGGYAKAQDESFYRRQREMMLKVVAGSDVVITTALIPGKRAPILVTTEMVEAMQPGSVIVDLAAERGGNCELTRPDEVVAHRGVTIIGPSNPASLVPYHASQMYSKNIITFLQHLLGKDGAAQAALPTNTDDEITRETLLTREGAVVHPRVRELLG